MKPWREQDHSHSYLENLWRESMAGNLKLVFFNTKDAEGFSRNVRGFLQQHGAEELLIEEWLTDSAFPGPYYPFLKVLREICAGKSPAEVKRLVRKAGVYHFQQPVFVSYLCGGPTCRKEEIIHDELEYERRQMRGSILALYNHLAKDRPVVLLVEDLHFAKESTLEFIEYLLGKQVKRRILMIFSLNASVYDLTGEFGSQKWPGFIRFLQDNHLLIDYNPENGRRLPPKNREGGSAEEINRQLTAVNDYFHFLALRECRDYGLELLQEQSREEPGEPGHYCQLLTLLGDVYTYLGEYDSALLYYNTLLNHAQQLHDMKEVTEACRKMSLVFFKKGHYENAERFLNQSLKLADLVDDEDLRFKTLFLWFLIEDRQRRSAGNTEWRHRYDALIRLATKLGMNNALMCCLANPYRRYFHRTEKEEDLQNHGFKLARRYKNKYRLATAYQIKGMVSSLKGDYSSAIYYYRKSQRIKGQFGIPLELCYSHNAIGHYYILTGDYARAFRCFEQALHLLRPIKNYHEIGMTLYNMATAAFLAFRHELAIEYLEKIVAMFQQLNMHGLTYHSVFVIYVLLAVNYLKTGNLINAYACLDMIHAKGLTPQREKNEEYFLYELAQALLKATEDDFAGSEGHFKKARKYFRNAVNGCIDFYTPRYYLEYGLMLRAAGQGAKALTMFNKGMTLAEELGYTFYYETLRRVAGEEDGEIKPWRFTFKLSKHRWITEAVKMEGNLTVLHRKINEINFLNTLQNILGQSEDQDWLVKSVMNLIHGGFPVEFSMVHFRSGDGWRCVFSSKPLKAAEPGWVELARELMQETRERMISRQTGSANLHYLVAEKTCVSIPLCCGNKTMGNIFLVVKKDEYEFGADDLKILSIAAKQLMVALEKIQRGNEIIQKNHELALAATTDVLTGLFNRFALLERLEEEIRQREQAKKKTGFTLLFLDLDHFKFYNDTFGHQVGDMILYKFAEVLKEITRENDFAARFGGDEFIIFLPDLRTKEAELIASRIKKELEKRQLFKPEIERLLGRPVRIPPKMRLSCSIGISEFTGGSGMNVETLFHLADKALYLAKRSGRGRVKTWHDLQAEGEKLPN
ncbi:MAG TPA: diguanylate cyclase [Firmicutes bacterium]|nr:diguanylate cyclase [Bacillota bacterium]HPT68012.1 diguanylate cyclase [Bacillota bacterium]